MVKNVPIKFIYLDVGGVLMIDFSGNDGWQRLVDRLELTATQAAQLAQLWDGLEERFCSGLISVTELCATCESKLNMSFPIGFDLVAECVKLFDTNPYAKELVTSFSSKYPVGLLTNMYEGMLTQILEKELIPRHKYSPIIDSYEVGCAKPSERIYRLAEQQAGYTGKDILFVDNAKRNIEAAKKLGWQTFLYNPKTLEKSTADLQRFIVDKRF